MPIEFIHDRAGFDGLAVPWNRLLARAATDVPFMRHEYLRAWWATLGGGEWPSGELWVGIERAGGGELAGVAPLFNASAADGRPALMFLGSLEVSDYLDLIVPPGDAEAFVESLLAALDGAGPAGWERLDLYNLPEASPSLPALEAAAARRGWAAVRTSLQPCPVIALDGDWETYLGRLDKKQRHELRRKLRRAETGPEAPAMRLVGPSDDLDAAVEALFVLMAYDAHKAAFLTPTMRAHFRRVIRAAAEGGWLLLAFLDVLGKPAAAYLNFDYRDRLWVYNSGLDPAYLSLSPGWVLLARLIRWAIEHGRREVDFLRGDEKYKLRLGGVARSIYRLTIGR